MEKQRGFTLLEICIVLVVIGLVVGGILTGKSLIRSSEIKSVGNDLEKYKAAIFLFKDQYNALPGDMKNATQFWGAVAGGTGIGLDSTCTDHFDNTHTPTMETCNGNGNGQINSPATYWNEPWRVWQHLANARLIPGLYTGQGEERPGLGGNDDPIIGLSSPVSKVHNLTHVLSWEGTITNPADYARYIGSYANIIKIGRETEVNDPVLKPAEAYELDSKFDDGKPATGVLRSLKPDWRPNCATTNVVSTAEYQVNNDVVGCNLLYIIDQSQR